MNHVYVTWVLDGPAQVTLLKYGLEVDLSCMSNDDFVSAAYDAEAAITAHTHDEPHEPLGAQSYELVSIVLSDHELCFIGDC